LNYTKKMDKFQNISTFAIFSYFFLDAYGNYYDLQ
jgi:hypothetical protein